MRAVLTICLLSVIVLHTLAASTGAPSSTNSSTKQTTKTSAQSSTGSSKVPTTKPPTKPATSPTVPVTTLSPKEECQRSNGSCKECLKVGSGQCVWCDCSNTCTEKTKLIPTDECHCGLKDTKWGVCWVNYEALIIACGVIGGILILGLVTCICCCCCCKGNNKAKYAREDAKIERKRADMKVKHDERRAERKAKTDEIRRKYGLIKEDNPYQRFDD